MLYLFTDEETEIPKSLCKLLTVALLIKEART